MSEETRSGAAGPHRAGVVLYDPNALNPYGAEVAAVLSAGGYDVTRWCRLGDPFTGVAARSRRVLWASRQQVGLVRALLSRHWGAVLFGLTHLRTRRTVVFLWVGGPRDLYLALLLVLAGRRVVYVDHNPSPERTLSGRAGGLLERLRRSPARRVVHSAYLAEAIGDPAVQVVGHPSYRRWVELHGAARRPGRREGRPTALFLGALRPDKGSRQLPAIARSVLAAGGRVLIAGRGELPAGVWSEVVGDPRLTTVGITRTLSDREVAGALREGDVLIAPYRDVTMSGSILMALSCGLPVAAFESPALRALLPAEFLLADPGPDVMAARAMALAGSGSRWRGAIEELTGALDQACLEGWDRVLAPAQSAVAGGIAAVEAAGVEAAGAGTGGAR